MLTNGGLEKSALYQGKPAARRGRKAKGPLEGSQLPEPNDTTALASHEGSKAVPFWCGGTAWNRNRMMTQ